MSIPLSFRKVIGRLVLFLVAMGGLISCAPTDNSYIEKLQHPEWFQAAMKNLTDIVVYDIFSPPVASRVYLYPSIAA